MVNSLAMAHHYRQEIANQEGRKSQEVEVGTLPVAASVLILVSQ